MRIATAFALVALLCLSIGSAYADKFEPNEKPWEYNYGPPRAIVPEAEPNDDCPGQAIACGDEVNPAHLDAGNFDWYSFSATAGDWLTLGIDAINGSSWDSYLELYVECGGTMIAYDDDSGPSLFSLISDFTAPQTGTYNAKVRGYSTADNGDYRFFVTCEPGPPPPENDMCGGAILIENCTSGQLAGDLLNYTNNYTPGSNSCTGYSANGRDAVYKLELDGGEVVHLDYVQTNFDASFYVVTDCANIDGSCVDGADNTVTGGHEIIDFTAAGPGTYYIILDAYGTNTGGPWALTYTIQCGGPQGACCIGEVCTITNEGDCAGEWLGGGTDCSPNPCIVIPVEESTWGAIKANYR